MGVRGFHSLCASTPILPLLSTIPPSPRKCLRGLRASDPTNVHTLRRELNRSPPRRPCERHRATKCSNAQNKRRSTSQNTSTNPSPGTPPAPNDREEPQVAAKRAPVGSLDLLCPPVNRDAIKLPAEKSGSVGQARFSGRLKQIRADDLKSAHAHFGLPSNFELLWTDPLDQTAIKPGIQCPVGWVYAFCLQNTRNAISYLASRQRFDGKHLSLRDVEMPIVGELLRKCIFFLRHNDKGQPPLTAQRAAVGCTELIDPHSLYSNTPSAICQILQLDMRGVKPGCVGDGTTNKPWCLKPPVTRTSTMTTPSCRSMETTCG